MEFRTLHYFLTVAQERNITRAAEKLHMAQPPLTRQIKRLEEEPVSYTHLTLPTN